MCELLHVTLISHTCILRLTVSGVISFHEVMVNSLMGPLGRSSGLTLDFRSQVGYESYGCVLIDVMTADTSDGHARTIIRLEEATFSSTLITMIGPLLMTSRISATINIEFLCTVLFGVNLIDDHFGMDLATCEHPKGGGSVTLITEATVLQVRIRMCDLILVFYSGYIIIGSTISDLVLLIGTLDIVLGSIDK